MIEASHPTRHAGMIAALMALIVLLALKLSSAPDSMVEAAGSANWDSPRLISTGAENGAFIPVLRADQNGRLIAVYNKITDQGVENPFYRQSLDGGKNWQEPAAIHVDNTALLQATLGYDDDGVAHAVWRTRTGIWHSREDQWPVSANPITSTEQLVFGPDIATAADGTLHVVWSQEDNQIYYASSANGGDSWSSALALTDSSTKSDEPAIAADDTGNLHVVWEERILDGDSGSFRSEIRYMLGTVIEHVVSWDSSHSVLSTGVVHAHRPSIAIEPGVVHVVFAGRVSDEQQYAYYTSCDDSACWGDPVDITRDRPVAVNSSIPFVLVPALALCDGTPYVYFHGSLVADGKESVFGVNQSDNWLARDRTEVGDVRAVHPSVACVRGTIHIVYETIFRPNIDHQIYYTYRYLHSAYLPVTVVS